MDWIDLTHWKTIISHLSSLSILPSWLSYNPFFISIGRTSHQVDCYSLLRAYLVGCWIVTVPSSRVVICFCHSLGWKRGLLLVGVRRNGIIIVWDWGILLRRILVGWER